MKGLQEEKERHILSQVVYYTIGATCIYLALTIRNYLLDPTNEQLIAIFTAIIAICIFAFFFLFKNLTAGKHYLTVTLTLASIMSYFSNGGLLSASFNVDFIIFLVFIFLLHSDKLQKLYLAISFTFYVLFIFLEFNYPELIEQNIYFSPEIDVIITLSLRIILLFVLIQFVKREYNLQLEEIESSNDNIMRVNYEAINLNHKLEETLSNLKSTQKRLVQSEKMASLGTLTAGVAHEINNPLNYMQGGITLLSRIEKDQLDQESIEDLQSASEMIDSGISRISAIVNSLRMFSFEGKSKLEQKRAKDILDSALVIIKSKISDIDLIEDVDEDCYINCYQEKIQRCFINLIDNAIYQIKKKPGASKLLIEIKAKKDNVSISFINEGEPIPEDKIDQIFDPFYTTKEPGEGTGLGLSITYNIIQEHSGFISAKNLKNKVAFEILIPQA